MNKNTRRKKKGSPTQDPVILFLCGVAKLEPVKHNLGRVAARYGVRTSGSTPARRQSQRPANDGLIDDLTSKAKQPVRSRRRRVALA